MAIVMRYFCLHLGNNLNFSVADLGEGPWPCLFCAIKEEMTEGRKAGWASKLKQDPLLSSKSGFATASVLLSRYDRLYIKTNGLFQYQTRTTEWFGIFPECTSSEYYVKNIMR